MKLLNEKKELEAKINDIVENKEGERKVEAEIKPKDTDLFQSAGKTLKWKNLKHFAVKEDYKQQHWWVSSRIDSSLWLIQ